MKPSLEQTEKITIRGMGVILLLVIATGLNLPLFGRLTWWGFVSMGVAVIIASYLYWINQRG